MCNLNAVLKLYCNVGSSKLKVCKHAQIILLPIHSRKTIYDKEQMILGAGIDPGSSLLFSVIEVYQMSYMRI